jgi:hypothetical protein
VYAVSWDGRLRQINAADGTEAAPAEKFMPGGGKPYALNLYNGAIYTATAQGCGGLTNAFYSFDLASRRASAFIPAGGGLWGRRGASISPEGIAYLGTGDAQFDPSNRRLGNGIVGVKMDGGKSLQLADYFGSMNELALAAGPRRQRDAGRVRPPRAQVPRRHQQGMRCGCSTVTRSGEDHRTTLHTTPLVCNDAGLRRQRRVGLAQRVAGSGGDGGSLVPFWGPVSKEFKAPIEHAPRHRRRRRRVQARQTRRKWQLAPAWLSRDMDLAEEAVIANGIVFAYAAGEDASQVVPDAAWNEPGGAKYGGGLSSGPARRVPTSKKAALYALDGQTGKELWSSGNQVESWNHFSGLTVANGRAYIATFDGVLYCFGVAR